MKIKISLKIILLVLFTQFGFAATDVTSVVEFDQPEGFTDFKIRTNLNTRDQNRLMKQLKKLISKSVNKKLTHGNVLKVIIQDIDMAGRFVYSGDNIDARGAFINFNNESLRVVNDSDRVSVDFIYELTDAKGNIIVNGDSHLSSKNPKFLNRSNKKYRRSYFTYVMPLFDQWLEKLETLLTL